MATDELSERFACVVHPPVDSDWLEVVRLARPRRRLGKRVALPVAAALVAVVVAAPAFGLGGRIVRLFSGGKRAPATVQQSFAKLDRGAPPGLRTGIAPSLTRRIDLPGAVSLWIEPTSGGGFCVFVDG